MVAAFGSPVVPDVNTYMSTSFNPAYFCSIGALLCLASGAGSSTVDAASEGEDVTGSESNL